MRFTSVEINLGLISFIPLILSKSLNLESKRNLTPRDVIEAPRPSSVSSSPDSKFAFLTTSTFNFDSKSTSKDLILLNLNSNSHGPSEKQPSPILSNSNLSNPVWISKSEVAYLLQEDGLSTLYLKNISNFSNQDPNEKGFRVGGFPTLIDNLKVIGASGEEKDDENDEIVLLFTSEVYDDGKLESVKELQSSERELKWNKVKTYDTTMVRHWDTWLNPRKRSQLFSVKLRRDAKGYGVAWSFVSDFKNLLSSTKLEVPVKPFGTVNDFSGNKKNGLAIFTSKDPELNPAWHTRQNIYTVPLDGEGSIEKISKGNYGATSSPIFSEDGNWAFWLEMKKDGFEADKRNVKAFDLKNNGEEEGFYLNEDWDSSPTEIYFSKNENENEELIVISTDDEAEKVFRIELNDSFKSPDDDDLVSNSHSKPKSESKKFSKPEEILSEGSTNSISILQNGDFLVTTSTMQSPSDVFLVKGKKVENEVQVKKLTDFVKWSNLSEIEFGPEPYQITYMGSEGREAHGWILQPPNYNISESYPLAVIIHGGPEGSFSDSWNTRWNPAVFAASGFVVLLLDPAGSTGFGQEYQEEILGSWGHRPYLDIRAGVHYALDTLNLDRERVVAAGASYGGYMINWIQGHNFDKLFKGLVCHDGVFSTKSTFYGTDELYFPEFEFGGVPWENREGYERWSPELHTGNWNTPQLIIHGGKDYRLTESEGLSAFNTLQRRGIESRLVYFPDENHWVLDPENSLTWHEEVIGWLKKWSQPINEVKYVKVQVKGYFQEIEEKVTNGTGGLVFQKN